MAKIKITKKEIEKMLKDQLDCDKVIWEKDGTVVVELDFNEIKKKKVEEHHHHYPGYPIYWDKPITIPNHTPYWTINTNGIDGSNITDCTSLTYNSAGG